MIIMISGLKQSGKDTCASYITKNYGFSRYAFADKIKVICSLMYDWPLNYIEGNKEVIDPRYGISPRQALQDLGTEYMQIHLCNQYPLYKETIGRNFWVKKFKYLYLQNPNIFYCISDYRFPHEYEELKEFNPITIRINNSKCSCDGHDSEKHILELNALYQIDNEGTITEFHNNIKNVMKNIEATYGT